MSEQSYNAAGYTFTLKRWDFAKHCGEGGFYLVFGCVKLVGSQVQDDVAIRGACRDWPAGNGDWRLYPSGSPVVDALIHEVITPTLIRIDWGLEEGKRMTAPE